jgi:hypothetical protein
MKKTFSFTLIALLLLLGFLSATLAAAEKQFALNGSLEASETSQGAPPTIYIDMRSTGNATHLGRYTGQFDVELQIPSLAATVSGSLVAADGSTLFLEGVGQGTPTDVPTVISIVETLSITGGTGRFAGATGNVTIERVLDRTTRLSSGTISGTIVLP